MRIGELIALRYENINFEKSYIYIIEAAKRVYEEQEDGGEAERVGAPKTEASIRIIPIHKSLLDMFKEMRKLNPEGELVFPNRYGNMRSYNGLRRQVNNFWADNDLGSEEITFHRFRHSYSTYMRSAKVRAALMGHLNNNVADDVYTDIENLDKIEAVQKYYEYMEDIFNAK